MRVSSMLVQGMWPMHSPLMQLPHLSTAQLRHFRTKKVRANVGILPKLGVSSTKYIQKKSVEVAYLNIGCWNQLSFSRHVIRINIFPAMPQRVINER